MAARPPTVAIVGLGTMGSGIAVAALARGMRIQIIDADPEATDAAVHQLTRRVQRHVDADLLPPQVLSALEHAHVMRSYDEIETDVAAVIEAVPERWDVKREVLAQLSKLTSAALASNTSAFPVDELATSVVDPSLLGGVQFFNPAEWIPGVEVVVGQATRQAVVDDVLALLGQMAKDATVVADSPGFIANRLQLALFAECLRCVEEGIATTDDIDRVVRSTFGFRLGAYGPFAIADMAGLDVYGSILQTLQDAFGDRFAVPPTLGRLLAEGRFGTKAGRGFAEYDSLTLDDLFNARDASYAQLNTRANGGPQPAAVPAVEESA